MQSLLSDRQGGTWTGDVLDIFFVLWLWTLVPVSQPRYCTPYTCFLTLYYDLQIAIHWGHHSHLTRRRGRPIAHSRKKSLSFIIHRLVIMHQQHHSSVLIFHCHATASSTLPNRRGEERTARTQKQRRREDARTDVEKKTNKTPKNKLRTKMKKTKKKKKQKKKT